MPLELATEIVKLIRLVVEATPLERRREAMERWFVWWEPFWKLCGLEVGGKEIPK